MLLRQSKPFGIVSHALGQHEAGGDVVVRLNILYCNFLLIMNQVLFHHSYKSMFYQLCNAI